MSLETSLRYLHAFHPASGVLLIGSGSGSLAPLILSLHVKEVILAEADREQIKRMQKVHTLPQEWKIVNAIVYADTPSCEYHYTNNTSANGIVPVDALKSIFPNLTLKSFELSNAISISTLLEQTKATQVNWLMVDCYTQMSFFKENQTTLESFDVIVVRLLKDEKQTLDAWMTEQGFRSVEAYEESNPQVLMVVYLKDFSGRLELSQKLHKESQERLTEAEVKSKTLEEIERTLEQQLSALTREQTAYKETNQKLQGEEIIKKLQEEQANYKKQIDELKKKLQYSGDAKIDEFINDIAPFFSHKAITYVDVGAFIGEVYMKMKELKRVNIREAHLFEPNPESYEQLVKNIETFPSASLHTYNIGIGKEKSKALFSAAKSMTKQMQAPIDVSKSLNTFECEIVPLSEFATTFTEGHIHLLKVDVEGNELSVFEGVSELLEAQQIDIIYMEVGFNQNGTQQTYFCKVDAVLQQYGYRVFKFYEQTREEIEDSPYLNNCHVAYMSKKFADANPYKIVLENYKLKQKIEILNKRFLPIIEKERTNFSVGKYWESRYQKDGNSGNGSYGRLAEFKAEVINKFISEENIDSVVEFGCGDGNQLPMYQIEKYVGLDISPSIIQKCKNRFSDDKRKLFYTIEEFKNLNLNAQLTLSIDVIFHLVEDSVFEEYMNNLFDTSERFCIIYSSNDENLFDPAAHVRHRKFTEWVAKNKKDWQLVDTIYNKYPYDESINSKDSSFADFYIYKRNFK